MNKLYSVTMFVLILFISPSIEAKQQGEDGIFRYMDERIVTLTERQHEVLQIIRSHPQTKEIYLFQLNDTEFNVDNNLMRINLPEKDITVQKSAGT